MEKDIPYQVDEMSHTHEIIEVEGVSTLHDLVRRRRTTRTRTRRRRRRRRGRRRQR